MQMSFESKQSVVTESQSTKQTQSLEGHGRGSSGARVKVFTYGKLAFIGTSTQNAVIVSQPSRHS